MLITLLRSQFTKCVLKQVTLLACVLGSISYVQAAPAPALEDKTSTTNTVSKETKKSSSLALHKAYIGLAISQNVGDSFYPVMMTDDEVPYIKMSDLFKQWLELPYTFENQTFQITIPDTQIRYWLNTQTQGFGVNNTEAASSPVPKDGLINIDGEYWLRYDIFGEWLPVNVTWSKQNYQLYIIPQFALSSNMEAERKLSLQQQKFAETHSAQLAKAEPIKPSAPLDAQARYNLNWTRPLKSEQTVTTQYAGNIDVFKGTLQATGSTGLTEGKNTASPLYWNYSLEDQPEFHTFQVGDFFKEQTPLVPGLNFRNGINFARLEQKNSANGFAYHGQTQPGTEVDVWHNGILITILTADNSGSFTFNDPNAAPGDRYLLRFYFKDGTQVNRVIQLSTSNSHLLEPAGEWNITLQSGHLDTDTLGYDTQLTSGSLSHSGLWYGVTGNLTAGLEAYHFPTVGAKDAGGADLAWQTLPTWSNTLETLAYTNHVDHDWQSTYTGLEKHVIQYEQQRISSDSPLKQLAYQLPYTVNSLLPTVLPAADRFWSIKDIYSPDQYQFTSEYKRTNVGDTVNETILTSLTDNLSIAGTAGLIRPNYDATQNYAQLTTFYYMNVDNLLQLQRTFAHEQSGSLATYRYQGLQKTGWDFGASAAKPDHDNWNYLANVEYSFIKNFSTTLSFDQHEIYLTLSYYGIVAQKPGPIDYNNYATGTVAGIIMIPPAKPGDKPTPLVDAEIDAGGEKTRTDSNGHYILSGLPVYQKVSFEINPASLDASLIPDKKQEVLYFRPGTYIEMNPKIDWSAGIDGNVIHDGKIPKGTKVAVFDKPGGKVLSDALVEPNGFFILEKLPEGSYYIGIENGSQAPAPMKLQLANQSHWISNLTVPLTHKDAEQLAANPPSSNNT